MPEARQLYEKSSGAAPEMVLTWLGWARMEEADRNVERAAECWSRAERLVPNNPSIKLSRAVLCQPSTGSCSQALAMIEALELSGYKQRRWGSARADRRPGMPLGRRAARRRAWRK